MPLVYGLIILAFLGLSFGINADSDLPKSSQSATVANFAVLDESTDHGEIPNYSTARSGAKSSASAETRIKTESYNSNYYRPPMVQTLSAENIEYNTAVLRGEVDLRSIDSGLVFVVYGYEKSKVAEVGSKYKTFVEIPASNNDKVRTKVLNKIANGFDSYKLKLSSLVQDTEYFYQICVQYNMGDDAVSCGQIESFVTNLRDPRSNDFGQPRVSIDTATNVTAYTADVKGSVDMKDGKAGIVFIVYGESKNLVNLVDVESNKYSNVEESYEYLQKDRIETNLLGKSEYNLIIDDLDRDTEYFYRLCVEFDGEKSGLECSPVHSFVTDSRDRDHKPSVNTYGAVVSGNSAQLFGSVRMLDFFDGLVFFVYGTDLKKITVIEENGSFAKIRQDSDKLQRVSVDNDHDGNADFKLIINDLKLTSTYFYRLCVEYVDENYKGREELFLSCGEVRDIGI
ncbi:hypothetical protein KC730_01095 [Candidatus Kaiserbacteria bacterium]|nr:hypothetical protein [Candidatus Kaiserbacteria bacterium]